MGSQWMQYIAGGLTAGSVYALVALGYSIIFNASRVINFAQGEFVMIGGMSAVSLVATGVPMPMAIAGAIVIASGVGLLLEKLAVERARRADVVTLIIITIGASIFLRGLAQLVWDKGIHPLPPFSGDRPIAMLGATIVPQSLWVLGAMVVIVAALSWFFRRTLLGKAMLATSHNRLAAQLVVRESTRVTHHGLKGFTELRLVQTFQDVAGNKLHPAARGFARRHTQAD